ncbi:uncharacterized protein LOC142984828 [Anticarsia gemmatalis]|uniref:uncharacterized protein LOC142984828 n=1 Tax=Anticarsia gemmatalis TaxID=129554 RepID=UPI003F766109
MSNDIKPITLKNLNKIPLLLNKKIILKKDILSFKGNVKVLQSVTTHEEVIYESKKGDFLPGDVRELTIVNRLNKTTNSCRTIARCTSHSGSTYEKTSDEITKLIGQNNYDILFSTLCSVINQDIKVRGIYSTLTVPKLTKQTTCQADVDKAGRSVSFAHVVCQTDESFVALLKKKVQMRKRVKRSQLAPYVIREIPDSKKPKRLVIAPNNFETLLKSTEPKSPISPEESRKEEPDLPVLGSVFDDDSDNSIGKFSNFSCSTLPEILKDPMSLIATVPIENKSNEYKLTNLDAGKESYGNDKPASLKQVLGSVPEDQRVKMILQQGLNDWHNCLKRDESGHLPIHVAVMNNDLDLLKRQCIVLKMKQISVDIQADNLTPLTMSLYQDNIQMTSLLLQYNADALDGDAHDKTCFHIAAEKNSEHLQVLVTHCQSNARRILEENEDLWKPEYANKTDQELSTILLTHINKLYDDQGYTPLMLASKLGRYENVKLLIESSPDTINVKMPSSGNTALYLAVSAACMDSTERGNKSKVVDHFRKTIEILVEHGSDPNLNNFAGYNVNDLLTEYNIGDLSMIVANTLTCRNFWDGKLPAGTKKFDSFMLVKDEEGNVDIKNIFKPKKPARNVKSKNSPIIQNVAYITPIKTSPVTTKSETVTGQSEKLDGHVKIEKVSPKVQTFRLNKPLLLKNISKGNKRKLEITESSSKKLNTND